MTIIPVGFTYATYGGLTIIAVTLFGIIKYNQMEACNECCNCPTTYGKPLDEPNKPFLYKSCVQSTQPFGYENSDLKSLYLSEYQLQCRMYTPVISQDQLLSAGFQNYN